MLFIVAPKFRQRFYTLFTCPVFGEHYKEFGQDGQPVYGFGPNDNPEKSRQIINALAKRCGPDGFHFMVGDQDFFDDEFDEEDEEEIDEIDGEQPTVMLDI